MLTVEQNDLLCLTGPGTPGGNLMRRYWQPVALSSEIVQGGTPLPVRLMCEDLVLFRDEAGRAGLLDIHCCHRGTDLSYGRLEDGGLRCLYHGWLYDVNGKCLEQPGEPEGSNFKDKVCQPSYPTHEAGGMVWAYLGAGTPPVFPDYEFLTMPPETWKTSCTKMLVENNWLQSSEGGLDGLHTSFLHRTFETDNFVKPLRALKGAARTSADLMRDSIQGDYYVKETSFGFRMFLARPAGPGKKYLRVTNFMMPNMVTVSGLQPDGYAAVIHVPRDDHSNWRYNVGFNRSHTIDEATARGDLFTQEVGDDFRFVRNQGNRYLQNREEMNTKNYAGMGDLFPLQDAFATETMGTISDKTKEHLGYTDKAVIAERQMLLQAVDAVGRNEEPKNIVRNTADNDYSHLVCINEVIDENIGDEDYCESKVSHLRAAE